MNAIIVELVASTVPDRRQGGSAAFPVADKIPPIDIADATGVLGRWHGFGAQA